MTSMVLRACLAAACLIAARVEAAAPADAIRMFFNDAFEERLRDSPEFATALGRHDYDDRWRDWSKEGRATIHRHLEARLKQLESLPTDGVADADKLSLRLFRYQSESDLAAEDLETHLLSLQCRLWRQDARLSEGRSLTLQTRPAGAIPFPAQ